MACLRKREGRMIEYKDSNGKWKSTHTKNMTQAEKFLERHGISVKITLGDFAKNMFTARGKGSYYELRQNTSNLADFWWDNCKTKYERYIRPAFGDVPLNEIDAPMIQNWYLNMDKYATKHLSASTLKKNLDVLSTILEYAIFKGYIKFNPSKNVFRKPEKCKPHEIYNNRETARMFPNSKEELERIWGSLRWACYFMVLNDTGFRPGEAAGISIRNYFPDKRGVYTEQSVDSYTGKLKDSIKTTYSKGYSYKIGKLSEYTVGWISLMIAEEGLQNDDLLFRNDRGRLVTTAASNKKLRNACALLGIRYRSCYSFRTTFFTIRAGEMNESVLLELMGHKKWRTCYDARTPEEILDRINLSDR